MRSSGRPERDLRHRVAQHAGGDRVALGVVGVQEAFRRRPLDHLGQLPSQVHRILHTDVEALSTHRVVHVCGVAGQQDASVAVGRGLPRHIGEPGDPGGTVDPVVGPVDGDERLAEIAQGGFGRGSDVLLGHHDPHRAVVREDDLAVADLVLHPTEGMDAEGVVADAQFAAPRPSRPRRSGCSSSDPTRGTRCPPPCGRRCVLRRSRRDTAARSDSAVGQLDVDAGVVLREARHLTSAMDRHRRARRPSRPGCARCGSATARARRGAGWGSR